MPIYTGVDPRWQQYQQEREDRAFNDLLQTLQYRKEKQYRTDAAMFNTFLENPEMIGGSAFSDWAERAGKDFDIAKQFLPELYAKREARNASIAQAIKEGMFPERTPTNWTHDAPTRMGDQSGDLLGQTGRPDLPDNQWSAALGKLSNDDFLGAMETLHSLGNKPTDIDGTVDPSYMQNLDPTTRALVQMAEGGQISMDDVLNRAAVASGKKMNAAQQQAHEDRVASAQATQSDRDRRFEETQRVNNERLRLAREKAARGGSRSRPGLVKRDILAGMISEGFVQQDDKDDKGAPLPEEKKTGIDIEAAREISAIAAQSMKIIDNQNAPEQFIAPGYFTPKGMSEVWRFALLANRNNRKAAQNDIREFYNAWWAYANGTSPLDRAMAISNKIRAAGRR